MRIAAVCAVCANQWDKAAPPKLKLVSGELQDTGIVFVSCPEGHTSAVLYDSRRYEILLRSGALALLDGYCNEAIASLSAALERAYEFYLRVVYRNRGVPTEEFNEAWKDVESQSERQLGAFQFICLLERTQHLKLDPDIPKIRNRTVHRGCIATESDARAFAELVFRRIREIEQFLAAYPKDVEAEAKHEIARQQASVPKNMESITLKAFSVKIDQDGTVVGPPDVLGEYLEAVSKGKKNGWL